MVGDVVCTNGPLRLSLSFADVDTSHFGVRILVQIAYAGSFQNLKWSADHVWIEYPKLQQFEKALLNGVEATLSDMSDYPILKFERHTPHERLTINPRSTRQSTDGESMTVTMQVLDGTMLALSSSMNEFPKWW